MTPKYRVTERDRWRHRQPNITGEAQTRWDERMPDDAISPEVAWLFSGNIDDLLHARAFHEASGKGYADELRAYWGLTPTGETYCAVFIYRDGLEGAITTVYRGEQIRYPAIRAYLDAWRNQHGLVGEDRLDNPLEAGIPEHHLDPTPYHIEDEDLSASGGARA
jgi:hypothetical protein